MAQNLIVNGVTYNGVKSITIPNDEGQNITYVEMSGDDDVQIAKLWENASPDSTFAAQAVGLNLAEYDAYSIYYKNAADGSALLSTGIVPVGQSAILYYITPEGTSQRRICTSSADGITFNAGLTGESTTANGCGIPLIIYSYKGITDPGLDAAKLYELPQEMTFDGTTASVDTGIQLFDTAKDFTIFMDATAVAGNYNLCLLDAARSAGSTWKGGVQFKTNASWNGDGFRICGTPTNGSAEVFYPPVQTTERTKMAVVYIQGVPSMFYYRTASNAAVTAKTPESTYGVWDYVQHDGPVIIGGAKNGGEKFIGTIHGCSIYNMVMPESEITKRLAF